MSREPDSDLSGLGRRACRDLENVFERADPSQLEILSRELLAASAPKRSQWQLAQQLGILPSRMVILIDELSDKGLVKRHRSIGDRRNYELTLTKRGGDTFKHLSRLAAEHEADLLAIRF
jgi:DNA-binding MarR family transcriptional regulator